MFNNLSFYVLFIFISWNLSHKRSLFLSFILILSYFQNIPKEAKSFKIKIHLMELENQETKDKRLVPKKNEC